MVNFSSDVSLVGVFKSRCVLEISIFLDSSSLSLLVDISAALLELSESVVNKMIKCYRIENMLITEIY